MVSRAKFETWLSRKADLWINPENALWSCWQACEADALERAAEVADRGIAGSDIAAAIRSLKEESH